MVKVSIIMPVYNVEAYIRKSLDSVVNQTLKDIEAICVDDCSPDGSGRILDEYAAKDKRIRVFHLEKNGGPGVARNFALGKAKGEYIMFLDPDDWYELNACELAYNQISTNQNDMVMFAYNQHDESTGQVEAVYSILKPLWSMRGRGQIVLDEIDRDFISKCYTWVYIYRFQFLKENNIRYAETMNFEDHLFLLKSFMYAKTVSISDKPLYNYLIRRVSLTRSVGNKNKEMLPVKKSILEDLEKTGNRGNIRKAIISHTIKNSLYWFNTIYPFLNILSKRRFYNDIRELFLSLDVKYVSKEIKKRLNEKIYKQYKFFCKYSYWHYIFSVVLGKFVQNLIALKDSADKKHKIFSFLGIKVKVRK